MPFMITINAYGKILTLNITTSLTQNHVLMLNNYSSKHVLDFRIDCPFLNMFRILTPHIDNRNTLC